MNEEQTIKEPDPAVVETGTGPGSESPPKVPPDDAPKKKKKKKTAAYYAISFFAKTGILVFVIWLVFTFILGIRICHSNSAYPSVKDGDLCVTNRLMQPETGNLIVYRYEDKVRYGRVIAYGGDIVNIEENSVRVNGEAISVTTLYDTGPGDGLTYPYVVPENSVFVLNDYRSDVNDSRSFGGIPISDYLGTVFFLMRMRGI